MHGRISCILLPHDSHHEISMPGTAASNDNANESNEEFQRTHPRGIVKQPPAQAALHSHAVLEVRSITTASSHAGVTPFRNEQVDSSQPHINPLQQVGRQVRNTLNIWEAAGVKQSQLPCYQGGGSRVTRRQPHQINRRDSVRHQAACACQRCPMIFQTCCRDCSAVLCTVRPGRPLPYWSGAPHRALLEEVSMKCGRWESMSYISSSSPTTQKSSPMAVFHDS